MKTNRILKILTLLSVILGLSLQEETKQSCVNPFTERFRKATDKETQNLILDFPKKILKANLQMCKAEWSTYGTCCDAAQLNKLSSKRMEEWSTSFQNFIDSIGETQSLFSSNRWEIVGRLLRLYEDLDSRGNLDTIEEDIRRKIKDYLSKPANSESQGKYDLDLLYFIQDEKRFEAAYQLFLKNSQKCFSTVLSFMRSMFCYMCSGRATSLNHENKLKIHLNTCSRVIEDCIGTWSFVYNIMHISKAYILFSEVKRKLMNSKVGVTLRKDKMGPDTALKSGLISYWMREISEVGDSYQVIFYMSEDVKVCQELLTIDGGNDDTAGNAELIQEVKKEFGRISSYEKSRDRARGEKAKSEFIRDSSSFTSKLRSQNKYFQEHHKTMKDQYNVFLASMKERYIPQIFDLRKKLDAKPAPTSSEKLEIDNQIAALEKAFKKQKDACSLSASSLKRKMQKQVHAAFSYMVEKTVKDSFVTMYKDSVVMEGKIKKLDLPKLLNLQEKSQSDEPKIEEVKESRILQTTTTPAQDTVFVSASWSDNAMIIDSNEDVLPSSGNAKIDVIKKFSNLFDKRILLFGLFVSLINRLWNY